MSQITILYGDDYAALRAAYEQRHTTATQKGKDIIPLSPLDTPLDDVQAYLGAHDLFGAERLIVLRDFLSENQILTSVLESPHEVVCIEEKLSADLKKKLSKDKSITLQEFKTKAKKDNAIFSLTNHFRARDPKNMWLAYHHLSNEGHTIHQMIGVVWWQLKSILTVKANPHGHGLKSFVATQANKAVATYGDDLGRVATELLDLYHQGHADGQLENRFEEWVLGLRK